MFDAGRVLAQVAAAISQNVQLTAASLLAVSAAAVVTHAAFLAANAGVLAATGIGGPGLVGTGVRRALILVGSMKTLPVAVAVLQQMQVTAGPAGGMLGIAVIPCVVAHFGQILLDSFLVQHWLRTDQERAKFVQKAS